MRVGRQEPGCLGVIPGQHKDGCITPPIPGPQPVLRANACCSRAEVWLRRLRRGHRFYSDTPGEALPIPDTSRGKAEEGGSAWSRRRVTGHRCSSCWPQSEALITR